MESGRQAGKKGKGRAEVVRERKAVRIDQLELTARRQRLGARIHADNTAALVQSTVLPLGSPAAVPILAVPLCGAKSEDQEDKHQPPRSESLVWSASPSARRSLERGTRARSVLVGSSKLPPGFQRVRHACCVPAAHKHKQKEPSSFAHSASATPPNRGHRRQHFGVQHRQSKAEHKSAQTAISANHCARTIGKVIGVSGTPVRFLFEAQIRHRKPRRAD